MEHLLEKIFVDVYLGRHIELEVLPEILDEISLAVELVFELMRFVKLLDGSLLSNTLGIKIGEKAGVFMEGSLITGLDNDFSGTQFNGAYFFRF